MCTRTHTVYAYGNAQKQTYNDNEMYLFDHKNVHEIFFIFLISITILVEETSIKVNN